MSCLFRPPATLATAVLALVCFLTTSVPASATLVLSGTGTSAVGNPLAVSAEMTIVGDTLTLVLKNDSPVASTAAADVLSSFYFDIVNNGNRPTLSLASGAGLVWQVRANAPDLPYNYTPPAIAGGDGDYVEATGSVSHSLSDLAATKANDRTWQFRAMDLSLAPFEGFGLGTVGNSLFSPNGFDPAIVGPPGDDQIAFGIYRDLVGDIEPVGKPMQDQFLVRNQATFTFSGVNGFTEADIVPATFGFGTGPDSTIAVPEPGTGTLSLAGLTAAAALLGWRRHRKTLAIGMAAAAGVAVAVLAMPVSQAGSIVVDDAYDFTVADQNWTPYAVGMFSPPPPDKQWRYADGRWSVNWSPVNGPLVANGNYLTSPVIDVSQQVEGTVDLVRISIAHQFDFGSSLNGIPPAAGQIAYRINGGRFQPISLTAFRTGGLYDQQDPFTPPLAPMPVGMADQTGLVAPTFAARADGYPFLLPLINDAATFVGTSPGFGSDRDWFVPSIATIAIEPTVITSFQVRLINANLGSSCSALNTWDVRYVQADFATAPEPGSLTLAGCGGAAVAISAAVARRRRSRADRETASPATA